MLSAFDPTLESHQPSLSDILSDQVEGSTPLSLKAERVAENNSLNKVLQAFLKQQESNPNLVISELVEESGEGRLSPPRQAVTYYSKPVVELGGFVSSQIYFTRKDGFRHLLWKLIFKGITVKEWFLMYHVFEHNLKPGNSYKNFLLFGILHYSVKTQARLTNFEARTKRIDLILKEIPLSALGSKDRTRTLLDEVLLSLDVPERGTKSRIVEVETNHFRPFTTPLPERQIGVGYKDHGFLSRPEKGKFAYDPICIPFEAGPIDFAVAFSEVWKRIEENLKFRIKL